MPMWRRAPRPSGFDPHCPQLLEHPAWEANPDPDAAPSPVLPKLPPPAVDSHRQTYSSKPAPCARQTPSAPKRHNSLPRHSDESCYWQNESAQICRQKKALQPRQQTRICGCDQKCRQRGRSLASRFFLLAFSVSLCLVVKSALKRASHFNPAETRRRRSMPRPHHLLRLAFAAIRGTPERPFVTRTNRVQRIPEFRRDSRVGRVLHHAGSLAILDFPTDLAAELKVIALVVNRPRSIGLHQDRVIGRGNQLLETERFLSRQQADVGHADHRQPVPSLGAHRPAGALLANGVRGFSRAEIPGEEPLRDDGRTLRRYAFVVEPERAQPRTVLLARVSHHIHQIAAIAQRTQLVDCEKGSAGEIRFHAEYAIQFNGVSDRFMDLQTELRAVKNHIEHAFGTLVGMMQRDRFFGDSPGVLHQLQLFNQLVALILPLPAIRSRIRSLLNFAPGKGVGRVSRASGIFGLMNVRAF